jgi:acyl transferase domain-containing protein
MTELVAFLFAGQGSQYPAMAAALHRDDPVFRAELDELCELARDLGGPDPRWLMLERGSVAGFEDVRDTHVAIVAVQLALVRALAERGIRPDAVLGLSLGEVGAAATAGALTARQAIAHAVDHGAILAADCPAGGMVAVLAPPPALLADLPAGVELALSSRTHVVLAGTAAPLADLVARLRAGGTSCYRMPVRVGFHSAAVEPAGERCRRTPAVERALPLALPMFSCLTGAALAELPAGHLWRSIREPIRFGPALGALVAAAGGDRVTLLDLGPGGSLGSLYADLRLPGDQVTHHPLLTALSAGRGRLGDLARTGDAAG